MMKMQLMPLKNCIYTQKSIYAAEACKRFAPQRVFSSVIWAAPDGMGFQFANVIVSKCNFMECLSTQQIKTIDRLSGVFTIKTLLRDAPPMLNN